MQLGTDSAMAEQDCTHQQHETSLLLRVSFQGCPTPLLTLRASKQISGKEANVRIVLWRCSLVEGKKGGILYLSSRPS